MFLTLINQFANILAEKDHSSYGHNTLGPLCLWQCFLVGCLNEMLPDELNKQEKQTRTRVNIYCGARIG